MGEAKNKLEVKKEAFEKDPERFVDKKDIIFATVVAPGPEGQKGIAYLCNDGIPDHTFIVSLYHMDKTIEMMLIKRKALNEAKSIVTPPGIITPDGK